MHIHKFSWGYLIREVDRCLIFYVMKICYCGKTTENRAYNLDNPADVYNLIVFLRENKREDIENDLERLLAERLSKVEN